MHDLRISVADILGRPGIYRDIELAPTLEGVRNSLARLTTEPATARLRAESVVEGVLVTGRVRGRSELECARCLRGFDSEVDLEVCELFVGPGYQGPKDDDFYPIESSPPEIDLEPMLRDAVVLALPLQPLCRNDCKGLCARCGQDLNEAQCDCSDDDIDPRWAELSALRAKLEGK